jgi:hypothetical protein
MLDARTIIKDFERNLRIVEMQAEGLSHADSLLQPPFRANCFNWVVGHLLVNRDRALESLDADPILTVAETDRYANESEPVMADGPDVIAFPRLVELLGESQRRLAAVLDGNEEALAREVAHGDRSSTVGKRIHFLYFHDTYHTGQTEILRQLAGTDDKVI